MSDEKGYNGWMNYETWCVSLWIGNDYGSSRYWDSRAQEVWDNVDVDGDEDSTFTREEQSRIDLAEALKDEFQELMPDLGCTVWADMLGASFSEVNWNEIADGLIEEVDKTVEEEEAEA